MRSRLRTIDKQIQSLRNMRGLALHEADQLVEKRGAQAVDGVVGGQHALRQLRVARHERIQRLAHHRLHQPADVRNIDHRLHHGLVHQGQGPLRDVHRQIAHALQVVVDLDARK